MKKSFLGTTFLALLAAASLAGCSSSSNETTAETAAEAAEETTAEAKEADGDLEKLVVGASPAPHAEILEAARDLLADKGYDLKIVEYTDYVQPNNALESGDLDANYFQHKPYLDTFNEENGTHLVSAGAIHYEPFGIYAGKSDSLDELADGAELKETDDYLSGQEICERLNVSRTAVWKVIKQLETEGYEIEAVRNRGYRLRFLGDVLSQAELESSIDSEWAGKNILYFDETDSTNTEIKKAAEKDAPHGTLAVADYQSMGKGRRGRSWAAPHGVGIWMSLLLRPELPPTCASMLTLVAALAVADGIREVCDLEAKIKWPNDIVVNGKKVCGILTEMSTELECINYIVTGIGINVANHEFPEEIRDVATSLYLETGKEVRRSQLIAAIMRAYEGYYDKFMENQNLKSLMDVYNSRLANCGTQVRVLSPGNEYTGMALGIDEMGELLVRTEDGKVCKVISGEVSVRGIYGYV